MMATYCNFLDILGKSYMSRGASSWFHNVSTYGGKILNIEQFFSIDNSFKSKLKIMREFGCAFGIIGKPF
jgi:hypothetical protein